MRRLSLLLCALVAIAALNVDRPRAAGPSVAFYGVGDLDTPAVNDSFFSVIRDATRVGSEIWAVGGGVAFRDCTPTTICQSNDNAIFWRFNGTSATLEALPHIDSNTASLALNGAHDISSDGRWIASQARQNAVPGPGFSPRAVRVDTTQLPGPGANLNLSALVTPALTGQVTAVATSDDGTVVYGTRNGGAIRFDTVAGLVSVIPFVGSGTVNPIARGGSSADGNVAVGSSFSSATDHRAYRYVHSGVGAGVNVIPLLNGGTQNDAVAVSPDGDLVLVTGNSAQHPNSEAYLYRASSGAITPLGAPNGSLSDPWRPGGRICAAGTCNNASLNVGGMTSDGSVVVMNFMGVPTVDGGYEYFRNQHGWFRLVSALAANGVDTAAAGWDNLFIQGISSDGTLVYGAGEHNGNVEGFVADFGSAAIALKDFNPSPVAPTDTSIIGAWTDDLNNPGFVFVFTDDGVYYHIEDMPSGGYGFERGFYTFDGSSITFTTLADTNGSIGASGANGVTVPLTVSFNRATMGTGPNADVAYRIVGSPGSFAGGWVSGNPTQRDSSFAGVAVAGVLFQASDDLFGPGDAAGKDTYTFTSSACPALLPAGLDCYQLDITNDGVNFVGFAPDGLTATVLDDDGHSIDTIRRVVDPATIPVILGTPLMARSGIQGQPFSSFDVDATLPVTFTATGLPAGLSIDFNTGVVSGTPTVGGQFVVTIKAANAEGVADVESFVLTISIPTPIGQDVTVQPVVSQGQGSVTLTFDDVTSAGETTVEAVSLVDLQGSGVPPPGNVDVGGVIYEVQTTASFTGLIELCFSYAGIDFGGAQPRLFHYENNVWVDITTTVDTQTQTICGATTSLSPFAILKSDIVRQGFYAPVNPIAGFLNTVKAGSTVPLKFEVFVNGVEKTTTTGIEPPTTQVISCDANAPEDPVETTTTLSGSGLRYDTDAGHFMVNWKVPTAKGCYLVQVKTTQDQLALTARFKAQ